MFGDAIYLRSKFNYLLENENWTNAIAGALSAHSGTRFLSGKQAHNQSGMYDWVK
jgi:hypothetical protein